MLFKAKTLTALARTKTRTQLSVLEAPRGRGQVLEDTLLYFFGILNIYF